MKLQHAKFPNLSKSLYLIRARRASLGRTPTKDYFRAIFRNNRYWQNRVYSWSILITVWHYILWCLKGVYGYRGGNRGSGPPPPPNNHSNTCIWFLINTGLDPLKKSQSCQASFQLSLIRIVVFGSSLQKCMHIIMEGYRAHNSNTHYALCLIPFTCYGCLLCLTTKCLSVVCSLHSTKWSW